MVLLLVGFTFIGHFNRVSISVAGTEHIIPEYGIDETHMGQVYSAFLFIYTLCMIPGGWVIERWGGRLALAAMGFASAVLVAATGLAGLISPGPALWCSLVVIRGLLGMVSVPLHPACAHLISQVVPVSARTTANGLVTAAALLGIAGTFQGFGWLMDKFGWPYAFIVCGLATASLALTWTLLSANLRRSPDAVRSDSAQRASQPRRSRSVGIGG